jgi:DNA-binding transcriptional LysR family regulator
MRCALVLKVALAPTVGREFFVPLVGGFLRRYPAVVPDLHFDNRQVDIVAEGFDVAIGGGLELNDGLIARELARLNIVLVASPAYLKAHRAPAHPQDLGRHRGLLRRSMATGMGIAMLPLPHALPLLEGGALVRVLRDWYGQTRPLSIYYTSRKLVPAKVRVFVDYIVEECQASGQAARIRQK